jgi:hypothetical protein
MESDEVWQIITHLEMQGFHITKKQIANGKLVLTLTVPLLSQPLQKPSKN